MHFHICHQEIMALVDAVRHFVPSISYFVAWLRWR